MARPRFALPLPRRMGGPLGEGGVFCPDQAVLIGENDGILVALIGAMVPAVWAARSRVAEVLQTE